MPRSGEDKLALYDLGRSASGKDALSAVFSTGRDAEKRWRLDDYSGEVEE